MECYRKGKAEGRRQKAEGRRQRAEGRRQKAEGRRQRAEGRRQKAEGRGQKAEGRGQKAEDNRRKNRQPNYGYGYGTRFTDFRDGSLLFEILRLENEVKIGNSVTVQVVIYHRDAEEQRRHRNKLEHIKNSLMQIWKYL
ncbi:MAG: hypothetical protein AB1422_06535 [bacterium]